MIKKIENKNKKQLNLKKIFKGAIIAIIITIILLIVFSAILTYSSVQENIIPIVTILITGISILSGAILSACTIKTRGILTGIAVGSIYIFFIYTLSSIIIKNFYLNKYSLIMIIISIILGAIGGIIGVNFKK